MTFSPVPWQPCTLPDWPATQAKHVFDISLGKMLQPNPNNPDDVEAPYIKAANVQWNGISVSDLPTMWASKNEIEALDLEIGDLLVCEGGDVGCAAILSNEPPANCIYQNALHRVRSENNDVRYLKYCLKQAAEAGWFDVLCNRATIAHFTVEKFRELRIHIPSSETQRLIADYLDRETARIDALVEEKETMLALLEEKRAALISRAVTRGLDESVPLKPSGLDWPGDIPAHWDAIQVRFACPSLQTGPFGSQLHAEEYIDNGIPVINPAHLKDNKITPDYGISVDDETSDRLSAHKLKEGDVVFARRGELGRCGVVEMSQVGWLCGTGSLRIRCDQNKIAPKYLALIFNGTNAAKRLTVESVGSTMDNLNTEMLGHFCIPYPPIDEQKAIVSQVEIAQAKTRKLIDHLLLSVNLAKERRAALITAAVTGQIDIEQMQTETGGPNEN